MLTPFRSGRYTWLWFSNAASSSGRWALVLVLSAQMLLVTHSSFWVGFGLFLTQGPTIFLAPVSGVLADRLDRRLLNVLSSLLGAVVAALFGVLTWLGLLSLPWMLALSLVYGIAFVFQLTIRSTLVPSLVPRDAIVPAISLFQVATQGSQFLGPLLATPLFVSGGPAAAWMLCSALYAASALLSIPVGEVRVRWAGDAPKAGLAESISYLRARPLVWTAIIAVALHCALTMGYQGMLPMFVTMDLQAPASAYGALLASIGLGAVIGSVGLAWLSAPLYRPAFFAISLVGSGLSLSVMAVAPSIPAVVVFGFFVGSTQAVFMTLALALIQTSVEDRFRGRATSVYQMITLAPMAVFGWGMGGLADITEPRPLMFICGIAFLVIMAGYVVISSDLRSLFRSQGWAHGLTPAAATAIP